MENGQLTDDHTDADKRVAAAFLAKAYAAMEDWANVEKYAYIAADGVSVGFPSNLCKIDNDDVLWGYGINDQNTTVYASFFSHIDTSIQGYAGALGVYKAIHNKLYDQISDNDARKAWWRKKDLATMKFKSPADFTGDYIYLRSADPYLLYVEALGEQGKLTDAAAALKSFLASRGAADQVDLHVTDVAPTPHRTVGRRHLSLRPEALETAHRPHCRRHEPPHESESRSRQQGTRLSDSAARNRPKQAFGTKSIIRVAALSAPSSTFGAASRAVLLSPSLERLTAFKGFFC